MNKPPPGNIRLDWLSWTMQLPAQPGNHRDFEKSLTTALAHRYPMLPDISQTVGQGIAGRKPYSRALSWGGVSVLYNPSIPHALIEISGSGCTAIGQDALLELLQGSHKALERLTRLDIALDIETPVKPSEIASQGYSKRFESHNHNVSPTGETYYVGSPKSDRYCRIYRYNPPHPRAHLLRFEYVTRRETAKATARHILEHGLQSALGSLEHVFSWKHPAASQYNTGARIKAYTDPNKKNAGTMRWIYNAVFPALERLELEGELSGVFWDDFAHRFPRSQRGNTNSQ